MIDTCVLYPTVMREVVLGCAEKGLFAARWSDRIEEEWARAAAKIGPDGETIARGEIALLRARFPDARVPVPVVARGRYRLPDPDDVHVLAAAVAGSCDAIMTLNTRDFPGNLLAEEGLARVEPDSFLIRLADEDPVAVRAVGDAVLAEARRLSGADWTMRALMKKARLPRLGKRLAAT